MNFQCLVISTIKLFLATESTTSFTFWVDSIFLDILSAFLQSNSIKCKGLLNIVKRLSFIDIGNLSVYFLGEIFAPNFLSWKNENSGGHKKISTFLLFFEMKLILEI